MKDIKREKVDGRNTLSAKFDVGVRQMMAVAPLA
jgi:hypothetical protein